jgi:hypothetical protein
VFQFSTVAVLFLVIKHASGLMNGLFDSYLRFLSSRRSRIDLCVESFRFFPSDDAFFENIYMRPMR